MMFRSALNRIEAHSENTMMVGDRMDTDVVAGIEAGLDTILVLTGSTTVADIERYPFRPGRVLDSIADCIELISIPVELAPEVTASLRAMKDRGTPPPRCHRAWIRSAIAGPGASPIRPMFGV